MGSSIYILVIILLILIQCGTWSHLEFLTTSMIVTDSNNGESNVCYDNKGDIDDERFSDTNGSSDHVVLVILAMVQIIIPKTKQLIRTAIVL